MKNKLLLTGILLLSACASDHHYNLPDIEDKNRVPAHLENPQNEEERIRVYEEPVFSG